MNQVEGEESASVESELCPMNLSRSCHFLEFVDNLSERFGCPGTDVGRLTISQLTLQNEHCYPF